MRPPHGPPDAAGLLDRIGRASDLLADGPAGPDDAALYAQVDAAMAAHPGFRLLTILRITPDGEGLQRMYSSHPETYPAHGIKPVGDDAWLRHLLTAARPQLSVDAAAVRRHFFDAQTIFDLGCASALNVPIRFRGRNMGTLNLLHRGHWYHPADAAVCQLFANLLGAAWSAPRPSPDLP